MTQVNEVDKPWRVVTTDGAFHSGWMDREAAQRRCASANSDASLLGIKTRYEVKETGQEEAAA